MRVNGSLTESLITSEPPLPVLIKMTSAGLPND